ncbi:malonic semialdehyde reductase [Novipirellula aureliae]|uniref:Malonic semialdehyde reductase n=1 Tax=Novipirellula aureliae TaxID=2527966 RepID=A0A5C6DLA5_9BACT|nr:nitroreductase family protein [Novipirellula aureliae]TWU36587.1 malonic semialdehyde reductase [Novipirellula aureliae]
MNDLSKTRVNPVETGVFESIQRRWSPYRFEARPVEDDKITCLLEAARWAASSFNDQPWSWVIARRQETAAFEAMLGCLAEANRPWAGRAGVLLISVTRQCFRYNNQPNRVALHDLGQAAAHMALQATKLDLQIHQMAGINRSVARQQYEIPETHEPQTAIAIGYPDLSDPVTEEDKEYHRRETGARRRLTLKEQTFSGKWGKPAGFLAQ